MVKEKLENKWGYTAAADKNNFIIVMALHIVVFNYSS